jgi:transposase
VKKILRGFRREETARFVAFRSHWQFEASFCTPREGHEKDGVEGEVGTFRRNHFVPVPAARDLEELNAMLLDGCREDEARRRASKTTQGDSAEICTLSKRDYAARFVFKSDS